MKRQLAVGLVLAGFVGAARADNVIQLWGPGATYYRAGEHYSVIPEDRTVRIHQGSNPAVPWYFQAYDDVTGAPGTIDVIEIVPTGPVGEIHLSVIGDANHPLGGAAYLKKIDLLTGADAPTTIDELDITIDLGELEPVRATNAGSVTVGNDIRSVIDVTDIVWGPVLVGGHLEANLACGLLGDLTISGQGDPPAQAPSISVGSAYTSVMYINQPVDELHFGDSVEQSADVEIASPWDLDLLWLEQPLHGTIGVGGSLHNMEIHVVANGALISVGTDLGRLGAYEYCSIVGDVAGTISVGRDWGALLYLDGAVTSTGTIAVGREFSNTTYPGRILGTLSGLFDVGHALDGELQVDWIASTGCVEIGSVGYEDDGLKGRLSTLRGPIAGTVNVQGHIFPTGEVCGKFGISGAVVVLGSLFGTIRSQVVTGVEESGDMTGRIRIRAALETTGQIIIEGNLRDPTAPGDPDPDLQGGNIAIDGSLLGVPHAIEILGGGMLGPRPFIAVDYEFCQPIDTWVSGACVYFGGVNPFSICENTPDMHIWNTSDCRGDMNSDNQLDFDDVNFFVLAISDPQGYALALPGLGALGAPWDIGGSRIWHGDCNCDLSLGCDDIASLVERISRQCCDPGCPPCPPGGGEELSPQQLASALLAHVAAERHGVLRQMVSGASERLSGQRRAYWLAVRDHLEE